MKIRNLLFDLGGVIMDIDRMRAVRALEALGMEGANDFLGEYSQKGPFGLLEEGRIGPDEFRREIRRLITPPEAARHVADETLDSAFCRFLVGIPVERLRQLEGLRRDGYRLGLLSNTNPIMWHGPILAAFREDSHDIGHYFDLGTVTSFEARMMKPSPAIFEHTARTLRIDPAETLFLDDSRLNVEAAESCGFRGAVVEPGVEFRTLIPAQ